MKVFISYCHEKVINEQVNNLADRLREDGIDCNIDQYELHVEEGWPKWMEKQISMSDYVLIICTEKFLNRLNGDDKSGTGVQFEVGLSYYDIYENFSRNKKYIPIIFDEKDKTFIPKALKPYNYYNITDNEGYLALYRRLTDQNFISKPDIGLIKKLPSKKELKTNTDNKFTNSKSKRNENIKNSSSVIIDKYACIELKINRNFDSYTDIEKQKLLEGIKSFLELEENLVIIQERRGSVIILLKLKKDNCKKLDIAIKKGVFNVFNVVDSKIVDEIPVQLENNTFIRQKSVYHNQQNGNRGKSGGSIAVVEREIYEDRYSKALESRVRPELPDEEFEPENKNINVAKIQINKELKICAYEEAYEKSVAYFKGDALAANVWINKYALKNSDGALFELTPDDMHRRIASEIARIEVKYPNPLSEDKIFELLRDFKYLVPQGSPMVGIGNDFQISSLSNCFVIGSNGPSDSYGGILKVDQEQVQLMKRRGGVGHDLSHIRPSGSPVKNSALTSTGIVPFMERYSNSTREVAQDGRRGALMLSISIKHPDVENFIDAKLEEGKVTGANISIKIDDEFMIALKNNTTYRQQYPIKSENPLVTKDIEARPLWDKIIHNAWRSAEPGILFWDTILRESVPDCYADLGFTTVSTNPCGEIPLCPYDSCRLLAINLYSYVENPFTPEASFNAELFSQHVHYAQRMMDDIIDLETEKIDNIINKINSDPEDEETKRTEKLLWEKIKHKTLQGRRTGIGITAEGDMLAALGCCYGSDEAISFSVEVQKQLAIDAYHSSINLAKERGAFPVYDAQKEKNNPFIQRIKDAAPWVYLEMEKYGRRNIALFTIAPTGSVSICTQTTSGIEPAFKVSYRRRRKVNPNDQQANISFTDESGDAWEEYRVFHPKFYEWLRINKYDMDQLSKLSETELQPIIEKSPYYKATANDINWLAKVKMQGAIQKWVDHSISVTINVPQNTTQEMISEIYITAWESGCKGVTIYRDGSRDGVLISDSKKKDEPNEF